LIQTHRALQGPPARCALRVLAKRYLQRSIQGGSHDSAVDARTALDLAILKMQHGPAFGLPGSVRLVCQYCLVSEV